MPTTNSKNLTGKQEKFIAYYVAEGKTQTEAARLAGYRFPQYEGYRLVRQPRIIQLIHASRQRLYQTDLARTFRQIGSQGAEAFYQGEIAQKIVDFIKDEGGLLIGEDMVEHVLAIPSKLGQRHAEYLIDHQGVIPEEFRRYSVIFPGTIWTDNLLNATRMGLATEEAVTRSARPELPAENRALVDTPSIL